MTMQLSHGGSRSEQGIQAQTAAPTSVIEPLEERRMMSVTSWEGTTISSLSGFGIYAMAGIGDNGMPGGSSGLAVGTTVPKAAALVEWDGNPDDGIDSGWRNVEFSANIAGTDHISWALEGQAPLIYNGDALSSISQVTIRAAVLTGDVAMSWQDVLVGFYRNGQMIEQVDLSGSSPSVDQIGNDVWTPLESGVRITPSASDYDQVVITGQVRLQAAEGQYPGPGSIFGDIRIYG